MNNFNIPDKDVIITVYGFLSDTKQYIGSADCYIPAHTGLPEYCTQIKPPEVPDGQVAIFDETKNQWKSIADHRGETVYSIATGEAVAITELGEIKPGFTFVKPTTSFAQWDGEKWVTNIDSLKTQKHAEINAWRDAQENASYTFKFNGHTWDYGKASQARLALVAMLAKSGQLPKDFFWTDAHNHDIPMIANDVMALEAAMIGAMVAKYFEIHQRQRAMKDEIDKLTDAGDIQCYPIGWS